MYECGDTVEQRVAPGGSNDERVTTIGTERVSRIGTASFVPILLTLSSLISDTIEQRVIPGSLYLHISLLSFSSRSVRVPCSLCGQLPGAAADGCV